MGTLTFFLRNKFHQMSFTKDEKVRAIWSEDGNEYNAMIVEKTLKGYKVRYYEFDDVEEDLPVTKIKSLNPKPQDTNDTNVSENVNGDFDQKLFDEVVQWLNDMDVEQYTESFKKQGFTSIEKINSWKGEEEITQQLKLVGCKPGSRSRLLNYLLSLQQPKLDSISDDEVGVKIESVHNRPMPEMWYPEGKDQDLDLTAEFTKVTGEDTTTVGTACTKIREGFIPKSLQQGGPHFYVYSDRHSRWFQCGVVWENENQEDTP